MADTTQPPARTGPSLFLDTLQVIRFTDVTPHMRRITLVGEQTASIQALNPGTHLKILIPKPDQLKPVLPRIGENGRLIQPAEEDRGVVRTYTLRRHDPTTGEIDIDFILHGDEGPASAWATNVQVGNYLGVAMRKGGIAFRPADWYLLAGDQTALPAISAILESLPASARGFAFIEIPDASEEQPIDFKANIQLKWLHRNGIEAGKSILLQQAIQRISLPEREAGSRFIWAAAEALAAKDIRDYLRNTYELVQQELHATAYWKLGMDEETYHQLRHEEEARQANR